MMSKPAVLTKVHDFGVRLEEMLIVGDEGPEVISSFPIKEITVTD